MYGCPSFVCAVLQLCVVELQVQYCRQLLTNKQNEVDHPSAACACPRAGSRLLSRGHRLHCCLAAGGTGGGAAEPTAVAAGATVSGRGCMKPCAQVRCGTWHRCWLLSAACRGELPACIKCKRAKTKCMTRQK